LLETAAPLKREVTLDEIFALYQQVLDANKGWLADSVEKKRRVCELFASDNPIISPRLDRLSLANNSMHCLASVIPNPLVR
jgi:hypothetical protein